MQTKSIPPQVVHVTGKVFPGVYRFHPGKKEYVQDDIKGHPRQGEIAAKLFFSREQGVWVFATTTGAHPVVLSISETGNLLGRWQNGVCVSRGESNTTQGWILATPVVLWLVWNRWSLLSWGTLVLGCLTLFLFLFWAPGMKLLGRILKTWKRILLFMIESVNRNKSRKAPYEPWIYMAGLGLGVCILGCFQVLFL